MLSKEYYGMIEGIQNMIKESMVDVLKPVRETIISMNLMMVETIRNTIRETIDLTNYMRPLVEALKGLNDLESVFSYEKYKNELNAYHWTLPYGIRPEELNEMLSTVNGEADFDKYMLKYFNDIKVEDTFAYIIERVPRKHRALIKQIQQGYFNKQYALINLAIISIIDDLISRIMINEDKNTNAGALKPLAEYLGQLPINYFDVTCFEVLMLDNNIDFIFENQHFSDGCKVESNKKVRRHQAIHGRKISNKKIDSLMLINTLQTILSVENILNVFKRTIKKGLKGTGYIIAPEKEKIVHRRFEKLIKMASESIEGGHE